MQKFFSEGFTEGVEGVGIGEGMSPPHPTSVMSSPSRVRAKRRPQTTFQHFLSVTERFRQKENEILLLNMVTILTTATAEIC